MATFFVGQRVRLVNVAAFEHGELFEGFETRILSYASDLGRDGYWHVDDAGKWPAGLSVHEAHLEPILPSGHTAGTESFQELMDRLNTQRVEKAEEVGA